LTAVVFRQGIAKKEKEEARTKPTEEDEPPKAAASSGDKYCREILRAIRADGRACLSDVCATCAAFACWRHVQKRDHRGLQELRGIQDKSGQTGGDSEECRNFRLYQS
jgi:hypothetical protein